MKSWIRTALCILSGVIVVAALSVGITVRVMNGRHGERVILSQEEYEALDELRPFSELMALIEQEHYGAAVDRETLLSGALSGMLVSTGDLYADYFTKEEYSDYLKRLNGKYASVGILLGQPDPALGAAILKVYKGSPAEAAGILPGDFVTAVDGVAITGLGLDEVQTLIQGETGTDVALSLLRGEETLSLTLTRSSGVIHKVEGKLFNERTGYIRIDSFTGNCVEDFKEAALELTDRKMRSLVIDLRNNPGGELKNVVEIADMILGECLIVTTQSAGGEKTEYRSDAKAIPVPLAVLVNEASASASEVLAGAIQKNNAGIIVGTKTYGKGVVQSTHMLESNQGWAKLTTAAYYLPDGGSVDGLGIVPDIEIGLSDGLKGLQIDQIDQEDDAQLWAALDEVRARADELEQ